MKFELSERITSAKTEPEVLTLLLDQFKKIAASAQLNGSAIRVKSIEASFGSINRTDATDVSIKSDKGSYLVIAEVNYSPSVWMWVFLVMGLFCYGVGFFIPIVFFYYQKKTVKEGIENVFQRVKNELQTSPGVSNGPTTQSIASQLKELNQLQKEGGLTEQEYQQMKERLMKSA